MPLEQNKGFKKVNQLLQKVVKVLSEIVLQCAELTTNLTFFVPKL